MDWREEYQRKLGSAEDAMKAVRRGDLVVIPLAGPRVLPGALFRHCTENGVSIDLRVTTPLTDPGWFQPGHEQTFRVEFELFIGDFARHAVDEGRATYLPNLFSLAGKELEEERTERRAVAVFLVSVTPPDDNGYVCFGAHNWNKRSYTRRARTVIAEVDAGLRPVCGDNRVHVSEIEAFVEIPPVQITRGLVEAWLRRVDDEDKRAAYLSIVDELGEDVDRLIVVGPIMTRLPPEQVRRLLGLAEPPEVAKAICGYVGDLVPDGATIQIGAGEPSMYLARTGVFDNKHDLGLHSEMVAPGRLVEGGVINGLRKTLHPGMAIASAWSGSDSEDLKIVTNNPKFRTGYGGGGAGRPDRIPLSRGRRARVPGRRVAGRARASRSAHDSDCEHQTGVRARHDVATVLRRRTGGTVADAQLLHPLLLEGVAAGVRRPVLPLSD